MPEANKIKKDEVMVDIDTSGPETEVNLPEEPVQETAPAETANDSKLVEDTVKPEDAPSKPSEQTDVQAGEQKER